MPNPSTIMGANALSWGDVDTSGMFQDVAGTVPAGVGDPVRHLSDGAGGAGYLYLGAGSNLPIRRADHIEFDGTFLYKQVARAAGAASFGLKIRAVNNLSGTVHVALTINNDDNEWYNAFAVSLQQNGYFNPNLWVYEQTAARPAPIGEFGNVQGATDAAGNGRIRVNGGEAGTGSPAPTIATNYVWLGGSGTNYSGGMPASGWNYDPGRYDIARFYVLDADPTPEQEAALLDWLENGDLAGPEPTGTQLDYWTGSEWSPKPLKSWSGTDWLPANLQRWSGTSWDEV